MSVLLKEVFRKAMTLPENIQDELASQLLEEIEWESRWDKTLAESQNLLDQLAEKALREHENGKTMEMGFDEL